MQCTNSNCQARFEGTYFKNVSAFFPGLWIRWADQGGKDA